MSLTSSSVHSDEHGYHLLTDHIAAHDKIILPFTNTVMLPARSAQVDPPQIVPVLVLPVTTAAHGSRIQHRLTALKPWSALGRCRARRKEVESQEKYHVLRHRIILSRPRGGRGEIWRSVPRDSGGCHVAKCERVIKQDTLCARMIYFTYSV